MALLTGSNKINIAVFISGTGSNLKSLIKFSKLKRSPIIIKMIISNNYKAKGLQYANIYKIKKKVFDFKNTLSEKKVINELKKNDIRLICLAGFMKVLSFKFIEDFPGQILNIHPSILPSIKGLNTHARAIRRKLHVHGATVHKVTEKLDSGIILGQTTISIHKNDTPHSLSMRLKPKENQLYVDTLRQFLSGNSKVIQKLELDT